MADKEAVLLEYKSLRDEIMKRLDQRLLILGFTVTGVGSVIGLSLKGDAEVNGPTSYASIALIVFVLVVIIAAVILTIQITRQIDVISSYIVKFVEPQFPGLGWESRWQQYRESKRSRWSLTTLPLGTSKPLAIYYSFLTVAAYSLSFVTGIYKASYVIIPTSLLAAVALAYSFDLYSRRSKGWKTGWDIVD